MSSTKNTETCPLIGLSAIDMLTAENLAFEEGDNYDKVMSQKTVTELFAQQSLAIQALNSKVGDLINRMGRTQYGLIPEVTPKNTHYVVDKNLWEVYSNSVYDYGDNYEVLFNRTLDNTMIDFTITNLDYNTSIDSDPSFMIRLYKADDKSYNIFFTFNFVKNQIVVRNTAPSAAWQKIKTFSYEFNTSNNMKVRFMRFFTGNKYSYYVYINDIKAATFDDTDNLFPYTNVQPVFGTIGCNATFRFYNIDNLDYVKDGVDTYKEYMIQYAKDNIWDIIGS